MRLRIITPREICLDVPVRRIVAEEPNGFFGMLPHHIDFVSQLVPGILVYETGDGRDRYAGINSGTLVKCGDEVLVSTRNAVLGDDLATVRRRVADDLHKVEETERGERSALARLEADMIRRLQEIGEMT